MAEPKKEETKKDEKPEDIIKKYKLKEGDYRLKLRFLEAQDLIPPKAGLFGGGILNPYGVAEVLGGKLKKRTKHKEKTLSPIWNETFIVELKGMKKSELEEGVIKFSVYDRGRFSDTYLGSYELDITAIYFSLFHQLNEVWLALTDLTDEREGCLGYLKVSLELLGPEDEPVIPPEKPATDSTKAEMKLFLGNKIKQTGHTVCLDVYRGECLAPLDLTSLDIDAFLTAKYAGVLNKTEVITSQNPIWNESLTLGAMLPNNSKFVLCEVWDKDLTSKDDLVGCFRVPFKDFQNKKIGPYWVNLYGPPLSAKEGPISDYMAIHGYEAGSHFRGRIMYGVQSWDENDPKSLKSKLKFSFPNNPEPVVPCRTYILRVDIFEGCELPERELGIVHVGMGPYLIRTQPRELKNSRCLWYESLPDKKVVFPDDPEQLPDIIIYFADKDSEDRRHSFCRLPAKAFLNQTEPKPFLVKMKEDKSLDLVKDDEFPGFIFVKIQLLTQTPPPREMLSLLNLPEEKYELRVFLYVARGLPPSDDTGTSDPFCLVRCAGQIGRSKIHPQTLNPNFFETIKLDVSLPPFRDDVAPPGLSIILYDSDDNDYEKKDLLGRSFFVIKETKTDYVLPNGERHEIILGKPTWHNVKYDVTDTVMGKVLCGYALIKKDIADKIPDEDIFPESQTEKIYMFIIGVRDIEMPEDFGKVRDAFMRIDAPKKGGKKEKLQTAKAKVKHGGLNINELYMMEVEVPRNREFCPLIQLYLFSNKLIGDPELMGIGDLSLQSITKVYNDEPSKIDSHFASELLQLEEAIKNAPMDVSVSTQGGEDIPNELPHIIEPIKEGEEEKKPIVLNVSPVFGFPPGSQPQPAIPLPPAAQRPWEHPTPLPANGNTLQTPNNGTISTLMHANGERFPQPPAEQPKTRDIKEQPLPVGEQVNAPLQSQPSYIGSPVTPGYIPLEKSELAGSIIQTPSKPSKPLPKQIATFKPGNYSEYEGPSKISDHGVSFGALGGDNVALGKPLPKDGDKKKGKAKMFSGLDLFARFRSKKQTFTYEDYDTDPDENFSVIPDWLKRRQQFNDDLEDAPMLKKSAIVTIPMTRGQKRGLQKDVFGREKGGGEGGDVKEIAMLKCVFIPESAAAPQKVEKYKAFMSKSKPYVMALYILRGIDLVSPAGDAPDTYLIIKNGDTVLNDKEKSLRKGANSPEYYSTYKLNVELPGSVGIRIEVWVDDPLGKDDMIGYTEIDMENRFFSKNWLGLKRKPVEMRIIRSEYSTKSQGRLELFCELYKDLKQKLWDVKPLPSLEYELRVIVWKTRDCVFKDEAEQCNDIFVRGGLATQGELLETDTHWRCRAEGSFNWRWKYKMMLPLKKDDYGGNKFKLQVWDRDVAAANDLIGECEVDLNIHKMMDKAYKRKRPVKMLRKWVEKEGQITEQIWCDVYHPEITDEAGNKISQGKVCVSFELVPIEDAKKKDNAMGRDAPNNYPVLQEPTGRLSFDIANPLKFIKDIIGPDLYRKCWIFICMALLIAFCVYFGSIFISSGFARLAFG